MPVRKFAILALPLALFFAFPLRALALDTPVSIEPGDCGTFFGQCFVPDSITIQVGDTVTWTNNSPPIFTHTATSDDVDALGFPLWDTGVIATGASATITFAEAGVFFYHCAIHEDQLGTINVVAPTAQSSRGSIAKA